MAFLLCSCCAHADVTDRLVYSYYIAKAEPGTPIGATLDAASSLRSNDKVFHAETKWYVNWKFWWHEQADGRCKMTRIDVNLDSRITMPALTNATDEQEKQFHTYLLALQAHELGHVSFGKQAALAIDAAVMALPEMASCTELENAANRLGNRILNDYKIKEIHYDVETRHGRTQGVRLE